MALRALQEPDPDTPSPPARSAGAAWVEEHLLGVWRYLRALGCTPEAADDLAQEAFLLAWRRGMARRDPAACRTFLRRTARHLFLRTHRDERRRARLLAEAVDRLWAVRCPDGGGAALEALRQCRDELQPRARRALELVYDERRSRAAAAAELGMKTDGIKTLLQRSKTALRDCVERRLT